MIHRNIKMNHQILTRRSEEISATEIRVPLRGTQTPMHEPNFKIIIPNVLEMKRRGM